MYQWLLRSVVTSPLTSAMLPKIMKSQLMIVIDRGRCGISHRLYGSAADFTPIKERAAAKCEDAETATAEH